MTRFSLVVLWMCGDLVSGPECTHTHTHIHTHTHTHTSLDGLNSMGTLFIEIALSAWMSAFEVLLDALSLWPETSLLLLFFFFGALRLLPVKWLRLTLPGLLTKLFCLRLPIFPQLSAVLGCGTNQAAAWVLSKRRWVMPRQRPLVPDGSSWILSLRLLGHLPLLNLLFACRFTYPAPIFPSFWLDQSPAATVPRKP